jgi:hypothetical protein
VSAHRFVSSGVRGIPDLCRFCHLKRRWNMSGGPKGGIVAEYLVAGDWMKKADECTTEREAVASAQKISDNKETKRS